MSLRIPSPLRSPGASYSSSRSSAFSTCSSCTCVSATRNSCSFTHPSRPTTNTLAQSLCPQHQNCSKSHPGVSRPRASAAAETDVLYVLSAADRQGTGSALASSVGRANSSDDEDGEELQHDEDPVDAAEEARVSAENLSKVPPFVPASGWIIIMPPDSQEALDSYSWTGKRLAMKFEGGWSIGSFRRKVKRGEPEAWCTTCANFESARAR